MELQTKFWYESNAFFGWIKTINDLKKALKYQLEENNGINNLDDFLDKSTQNVLGTNDFGTRREHIGGKKTLRVFLEDGNFDFKELE